MQESWTEPHFSALRPLKWIDVRRVGRLGAHNGQPAVANIATWWGGSKGERQEQGLR